MKFFLRKLKIIFYVINYLKMKTHKNIMKPDLMKFEDIYNLRAVKYLYTQDNETLITMMDDEKK